MGWWDKANQWALMTFRLYPIGEDGFGRKGGMLKLKFSEGCLLFDDLTCKKL